MATKYKHFRSSRALVSLLLLKQQMRCVYCACGMVMGDEGQRRPTIDHKTPLHLGGDPYGDNVVVACHFCNTHKGPLDAATFMALRGDGKRLKEAVRKACREAEDNAAGQRRRALLAIWRKEHARASRRRLWAELQQYIPVLNPQGITQR